MQGTRLTPIALSHTTWADWKTRHPDTVVMTENTGFNRNYQDNPYRDYKLNRKLWFPVAKSSDLFHPKELIIGVELNGASKAYPFSELTQMPAAFEDTLNGQTLKIHFSKQHQTANIVGSDDKELPSVITFWFAWYAFHPETLIFKGNDSL